MKKQNEKLITMKSSDGNVYVFRLVKSPNTGYMIQNVITEFWYSIIVRNTNELRKYLQNKGWKV